MNDQDAIKKLKKLKLKIGLSGKAGLKARIEFVCLVFVNRLKDQIIRYELFDQHNLGERDFDTCFEMHDGDLVVHGLLEASFKEPELARGLKADLSLTCYKKWTETHQRIANSEKKTRGPQLSLGFN